MPVYVVPAALQPCHPILIHETMKKSHIWALAGKRSGGDVGYFTQKILNFMKLPSIIFSKMELYRSHHDYKSFIEQDAVMLHWCCQVPHSLGQAGMRKYDFLAWSNYILETEYPFAIFTCNNAKKHVISAVETTPGVPAWHQYYKLQKTWMLLKYKLPWSN